ncbi:MAG: exo-beta-N-acetylmuramidase NamZ domain-containing protein [Planctomycetota bacterium]
MPETRSAIKRVLLAATIAVSWFNAATLLAIQLPGVTPDDAGLDGQRLNRIATVIEAGIEDEKMPGCVVCVGRSQGIVYLEAFGQRKLPPDAEPMTTDTVFDMASITKPVVTATCIMKLVEEGRLRLSDRVEKFFPSFGVNGKEDITIHDLLTHQSGLIPDNALADYLDGPELAWQRICELDLICPVGESFRYSDVNFIVLAELVRHLTGRDVNEYSKSEVFGPLGMNQTGFLPGPELQRRAAVTEMRDGKWMRGEVHDPRAYELGGVAGHAGLFSTATDMAVYSTMMLGRGTYHRDGEQVRVLSPRTFEVMTQPHTVSSGTRGLGWDKQTGFSSNKGDLLSDAAFGHGGFTGTVLWIDPELDLYFIFMSNRVHPDNSGAINHLAGQLANIIASSIIENPDTKNETATVLPGVDVLAEENFKALANQRVGLITNQTGRSSTGKSTVQILLEAGNVDLVALFSPEHGIEGRLDDPLIEDGKDSETGLQIYSLYGASRAPTEDELAGVDTLVFDIQDVGTRFYTYISTMGEAMKAAAEHGKRFVVLDRPNPIDGITVTGPMLDEGMESFVAFHSMPVRHGMTVGEIALMLHGELDLDLDLAVVTCEGWRRDMTWDRTGLTWINPSPNMRCLTQALLYPGIGLLETTNLSVGRGTDTPFEVVGAPWLDNRALTSCMNHARLPGVTFVPIEFTPKSSVHEGEQCFGINVIITNRNRFQPVRTGVELARQIRLVSPEYWDTDNLNTLLRNRELSDAIISGELSFDAEAYLSKDLSNFLILRDKYLIYRD